MLKHFAFLTMNLARNGLKELQNLGNVRMVPSGLLIALNFMIDEMRSN